MPVEFGHGEYHNTRAFKFRDVEVIGKHEAWRSENPKDWWMGTHVNVHVWYELANGYAVGFNENPSSGWSFPVYNIKREKENRANKLSAQDWLNLIDDSSLHHIGEYYTYLTNKIFYKKVQRSPTRGFVRWLAIWEKTDEYKSLNLERFTAFRSKWVAFLFRMKSKENKIGAQA